MTNLIHKFNFIVSNFNTIFFLNFEYISFSIYNIYLFSKQYFMATIIYDIFHSISHKKRAWNTSTWNFLSCKSNLSYFISKRTFSFVIHEYFCLLKILQTLNVLYKTSYFSEKLLCIYLNSTYS